MLSDPSQLPHLDAARFAAAVDPASTALLVIDIQHDFVAPGGMAARLGGDSAAAARAIDAIEPLIAGARATGMPIVFMRVVTNPEADHPAMLRLKARRSPPSTTVMCRAGSGGEELYRVTAEPGDLVIDKPLFDSFHATGLDEALQARGIGTLLLCGVATDCCVDSTARRAYHLDYDVIVVSDACAGASAFLHLAALAALERNVALLVTSEVAVAALAEPAA